MSKILNLTQHPATPEQLAAGVFEPSEKGQVQRALTFDNLPSPDQIASNAQLLAAVATVEKATAAMIGGAPYLMAPLERALAQLGVECLYAFSKRESVDQPQPDGSVKKVAVFRHSGFVRSAP